MIYYAILSLMLKLQTSFITLQEAKIINIQKLKLHQLFNSQLSDHNNIHLNMPFSQTKVGDNLKHMFR